MIKPLKPAIKMTQSLSSKTTEEIENEIIELESWIARYGENPLKVRMLNYRREILIKRQIVSSEEPSVVKTIARKTLTEIMNRPEVTDPELIEEIEKVSDFFESLEPTKEARRTIVRATNVDGELGEDDGFAC